VPDTTTPDTTTPDTTAPPQPAAPRLTPAPIPPTASWLDTVTYYRSMAHLPAVPELDELSRGARQHACWMTRNTISHYPEPGTPGYTDAGAQAARQSNLVVSEKVRTERQQIETWMTAPFHAIGLLRDTTRSYGWGRCVNPDAERWQSAAALNVRGGTVSSLPRAPVLWPGDGTTTHLRSYAGAEWPDPLAECGWTGDAGLPVIALLPERAPVHSATITTGDGHTLDTCTITTDNADDATARQLLLASGGIIVIPRNPLNSGTHTVTITTGARTVRWTFRISDRAAQPAHRSAAPLTSSGSQRPWTLLTGTTTNPRYSRTVTGTDLTLTGTPGQITGHTLSLQIRSRRTSTVTITNCTHTNSLAAVTVTRKRPAALTIPTRTALCLDATRRVTVRVRHDAIGGTSRSGPHARTWTSVDGDTTTVRHGTITRLHLPDTALTGTLGTISGVTVLATTRHRTTGRQPSIRLWNCTAPTTTARTVTAAGSVEAWVPIDNTANGICSSVPAGTTADITITGVFTSDGTTGTWQPTRAARLADTTAWRTPALHRGWNGALVQAGEEFPLPTDRSRLLRGAAGISALVTVTDPAGGGQLSLHTCGQTNYRTLLRYRTGTTGAVAAQLPVSRTSPLCVTPSSATALTVTVTGIWQKPKR
jgi:hypothetical protein